MIKQLLLAIPAAKDGGTVILTEVKKTVDPTPTPAEQDDKDSTTTPATKVDWSKEVETIKSATSITLDKKTAGKQQNDTKKAAPKSGDDNEAATYVCLLGLAMVAITAATYRKKRACN